MLPASICLTKPGMSMFTGQPLTQPGFAQSRQRLDSSNAISGVRPWFTSSCSLVARYAGSNSGIFTRSIAVRSLGFIAWRSATRHSASRESVASLLAEPFWYASYAAISSGLYERRRDIISSQSTWCASNSGPSTQTNRVFPPTVTRQAPHMPVPSTMMVFRLASVGRLYLAVVRATNFIMIAGPMAMHLSTCSRLMTCSTPTVTTPFCPIEPSSVMTMTSSEYCASWSLRMIRSLLRAARTVMTRFPAALSAWAIGNIGAAPTPPQAQITVPYLRISVALPSGPTRSASWSPTFIAQSLADETPIRCTTSVIVPAWISASLMVSGIRSECSSTRTITKWPARRLLAISGASTTSSATLSEKKRLLMMVFIIFIVSGCYIGSSFGRCLAGRTMG